MRSLDDLASKFFRSIGNYKRSSIERLQIYREIDRLLGYSYMKDYDDYRDGVSRKVKEEKVKKERLDRIADAVDKVEISDFELIQKAMSAGADYEKVIRGIAALRGVSDEEVKMLFILYLDAVSKSDE